MRALGDPYVWDAYPALELPQGPDLHAFPVGVGASRPRLLTGSSRQPYRHTLASAPPPIRSTRSVVVSPAGGK